MPNYLMSETKLPAIVRVRVLRGFLGYPAPGAADGEPKPDHLPGAVIDLQEYDARIELHMKRVEKVDPSTPLREGDQPVTRGTEDEDARDRATLARAQQR